MFKNSHSRRTSTATKRNRIRTIEPLEHRQMMAADLFASAAQPIEFVDATAGANVVASVYSTAAAGTGQLSVAGANSNDVFTNAMAKDVVLQTPSIFGVKDGVLIVPGTTRGDEITVTETDSEFIVTKMVRGDANSKVVESVPKAGITKINIVGLAGNDILRNETSLPSLIGGGSGNDQLFGGSGADEIYGGVGNDTLVGGAGNDVLLGEEGNDRLIGQGGDDQLTGGANDDVYIFAGKALGADTIHDAKGVDMLDFRDLGGGVTIDLQSTARQRVNSQNLSLRLTGKDAIERVYGSAFADVIRGNELDNELFGMGGDDELEGRGGDDALNGGNGDDSYVFAGKNLGRDEVFGSSGENTLDFRDMTKGVDVDLQVKAWQVVNKYLSLKLETTDAIDHVLGTDYNDAIYGNSLDNILKGGKGNDRLYGRKGDDSLYGGDGDDRLEGGAGADTIRGGAGDDELADLIVTKHNFSLTKGGGGTGDKVFRSASFDVRKNNVLFDYDLSVSNKQHVDGTSLAKVHDSHGRRVGVTVGAVLNPGPAYDAYDAKYQGTVTFYEAPAEDDIKQ